MFTADVGTPTVWAARYLAMNGRRRLIGSFVHGSMANAMPRGMAWMSSVVNTVPVSTASRLVPASSSHFRRGSNAA